MEAEQVEAKHFKKGRYILIDGVPCVVSENAVSAPGKHGHAKCRITCTGILDGKKRVIMRPGDSKLPCPSVDKRKGQIVSIQGNVAQIMDTETYEVFESEIPEKIRESAKEGMVAEYWIIGGEIKAIISVKGEE